MPLELTSDTVAWLAAQPKDKRSRAYREIGQSEWSRCADDLLYWMDPSRHLFPYVYTKDPKQLYSCNLCTDGLSYQFNQRHTHLDFRHHIPDAPDETIRESFTALDSVRAFTMFPYIEPIVRAWLREQVVLVEKSRDMMMTWLAVTMYTWDTIFHPNRENMFQSENSTKTNELVQRAYFIWSHQPTFLKDVHKGQYTSATSRSGLFRLPSLGSSIMGMPEGSDQIRQYHPSGLFVDEAAFQTDAGAAFMAVKPAIQAGGRYTAVSSANPGFFYAACKDTLEIT